MANIVPNYRDATELIKDHFRGEGSDFDYKQTDLREHVAEWLYSAYLQGIEEGFEEGKGIGEDEGWEIGHQEGYDEGYDDATAEYETYD